MVQQKSTTATAKSVDSLKKRKLPLDEQSSQETPAKQPKTIEKFKELDIIQELKEALASEFKFETMTMIQKQSIPLLIDDSFTNDIIAQASTGSGKTLAFLVPAIHHLCKQQFANKGIGALILAPTRELAIQIHGVANQLLQYSSMKAKYGLTAGVFVGGESKNVDMLKKCNIMIASPGRCLDLLSNVQVKLENLKFWILDEADMLIDVGFQKDIKKIGTLLPNHRSNLLFSATISDKVEELASFCLKQKPVRIGLDTDKTTKKVNTLTQKYCIIPSGKKFAALISLLKANSNSKIIIFVCIKMAVRVVSLILNELGFKNQCIHGNMKQNKRTEVFQEFMKGQQKGILVSTDVSARGVDFPNVDLIIQCDIPEQIPQYFHRVGRTARGGKSGTAILLLTEKEVSIVLPILKNHINEAKEDDLLSEYALPAGDLLPIQNQIERVVQKDSEIVKTASIIVQLYAKVFSLFGKRLGFKRNDYDEKGVRLSFGLLKTNK